MRLKHKVRIQYRRQKRQQAGNPAERTQEHSEKAAHLSLRRIL